MLLLYIWCIECYVLSKIVDAICSSSCKGSIVVICIDLYNLVRSIGTDLIVNKSSNIGSRIRELIFLRTGEAIILNVSNANIEHRQRKSSACSPTRHFVSMDVMNYVP